jgi:hypothetical protein
MFGPVFQKRFEKPAQHRLKPQFWIVVSRRVLRWRLDAAFSFPKVSGVKAPHSILPGAICLLSHYINCQRNSPKKVPGRVPCG